MSRPDPRIPPEREARKTIRRAAEAYVRTAHVVPPLSMEELHHHASNVCRTEKSAQPYGDFVTVLVGNEVWRDTIAAIPFDRRILLLPQCLRKRSECPATSDEVGLLCEGCGRCLIGTLQAEAEALGYVVLVAEGTTVVTRLLESGRVDAVIGVSCLSVLEKSFPALANDAVPGIAVPLLRDGCDETDVDVDWVRESLSLRAAESGFRRFDLQAVRREVRGWFEAEALARMYHGPLGETEQIAIDWLERAGKRWRPFLVVCVYRALVDDDGSCESIRRLALAVECFHKASLVHDDIEDEDDMRYGQATLHREHGIAVALNVGDFLLGEGYRWIAVSECEPSAVPALLRVAAEGHRDLCLGQGDELTAMACTRVPPPRDVLEIFRRKTAPAFRVALSLGAIAAGADGELCAVLKCFSDSLGIAYQIRDDLADGTKGGPTCDLAAGRPSLLASIMAEQGYDGGVGAGGADAARLRRAEDKARQLLEHYRNEAVRALNPLRSASLKGLLRRIASNILEPRRNA